MVQRQPPLIKNLDGIKNQYDGFLFDAFGVLLDGAGLIRGAADAWHALRKEQRPCWIVTNGATRSLAEAVHGYRELGLDIRAEEIISSVSLLPAYFESQGWRDEPTCVLGTKASSEWVKLSGGRVVDPLSDDDFSILVLANQTEYPLLETMDRVFSQVCRRIEAGLVCHNLLVNPDLIYPKGSQQYGFTAGALALMLEAGWRVRLGSKAPTFIGLGKPHQPIFAEASRRAGHKRLLMIGDQLETDIRGANEFGIDSLLVGTGLAQLERLSFASGPIPTYRLDHWM